MTNSNKGRSALPGHNVGRLVRKATLNLALAMFGILLGLIVLEIGLRLISTVPTPLNAGLYNPWKQYVGWAGNPYQVRRPFSGQSVVPTIVYNSQGLRDVARDYDKPADTFRILILGDSFVEGEQVELPETFFRLLENQLNAEDLGPRIEIVAAGVGGWGTDQQVLYYENEGFKYNADLVLLMVTVNDVTDSDLDLWRRSYGWNPEKPPPKPYFAVVENDLVLNNFPFRNVVQPADAGVGAAIHNGLYVNLFTYRIVIDFIQTKVPVLLSLLETKAGIPVWQQPVFVVEADDSVEIALGLDSPQLYVYTDDYPDEYNLAWDLVHLLIRRLEKDVEEKQSRLAIISNTSHYATYPDDWSAAFARDPRTQDLAWDWYKPGDLVRDIAQEHDVPFLDLQYVFTEKASTMPDLHIPDDGHWSIAGHQLVAETMFTWLKETCLVPCQD